MRRGFRLGVIGILVWTWGAGLPGTGLWAQEVGEKAKKEAGLVKLEEIVITATKTPRHPEDIPASITVITKEDLEKQNIQTVDEALRQVPGTFARRGKGWQDTRANVNLRGFPSSTQIRTLVLLDGQDMSSAYTTAVQWSSLAVEDIERIEVVRGPFSALYGGNAMGGVINIITKTPKKLQMRANMGYGKYDTWTYYLGVGNRFWDKLSLQLDYKYRYTSGYPADLARKTAKTGAAPIQVGGWKHTLKPTGTDTYIIGDKGDNSWYDIIGNLKLSWDLAPGHKIKFSTLLDWNEYGYGQFHTYLRDAATGAPVVSGKKVGLAGTGLRFSYLREGNFLSGDGRSHTAIYNLNSEHQVTDTTTLRFHAGLTNQPHNWYTSPDSKAFRSGGVGTLSSTPSKNWDFEAQVDQGIGTKQVLTGGLSYRTGWAANKEYALDNWRDLDTKTQVNNQGGGRDRQFGFFLQDEIAWHPKFTTVIGARLDWWQTYGGAYQETATAPITHLPCRDRWSVSPKIAFLYRPWDWMSWRVSGGRAFRPPNVYELYRTWTSRWGTKYKSNPNLKPEKTWSWEIGTTLKPFKGNVFTATYFENYVDDMIYRTTDPTDDKVRNYNNAAKARIKGVEMEIRQKLDSWLEVFGNMTLINARIHKNPYNVESVGKKLTYVPRQQFNFGVNVNYWKVMGSLNGRYVSKMHTRDDNSDNVNNVPGSYDPFFTLDSKLTVTPVKWMNVSFSVDNLLNRRWFYSYLTPGRTFWLEAGLKY